MTIEIGPAEGISAEQTVVAARTAVRSYRPDVQGLRALAVLLVILNHANVSFLGGGYVGVDVFFVISGFVITSVLLRDREKGKRFSLADFYARRARRIFPAAILVLIVTVVASYPLLGVVHAGRIAVDGQWAAAFMANIHFAIVGTNYLNQNTPPSPLQHFWSLAVEEQFYVVWPLLLLLTSLALRRLPLRAKATAVLVIICAASLTWSVVQTPQNGIWAYFSPLTRAWELGLGCLIAVVTPRISLSARHAMAVGLIGLGAVIAASMLFDANTTFPGCAVALPVVGAAMIIVAGTSADIGPVGWALTRRPALYLGDISYTVYLCHWPILILVAEHVGHALPVSTNLMLVAVSVVVAAMLSKCVEGPIRFSPFLRRRTALSVTLGVAIVAVGFGVCSLERALHQPPRYSGPVGYHG
jgi:peptidoglycan/LPS O-acetylase OafA/YrhL